MKLHRTFTLSLASLAIAGSLAILSVPAFSQPSTTEHRADRQVQMQERIATRLDQMAKRLKIDASQEAAWSAYAQTVKNMVGTRTAKLPADADAAAIAHFRAQLAAEHAQRLAQLADATTTLQKALNPEQQATLNEMAKHNFRSMRHRAHGSPRKDAPQQQ